MWQNFLEFSLNFSVTYRKKTGSHPRIHFFLFFLQKHFENLPISSQNNSYYIFIRTFTELYKNFPDFIFFSENTLQLINRLDDDKNKLLFYFMYLLLRENFFSQQFFAYFELVRKTKQNQKNPENKNIIYLTMWQFWVVWFP